MWYLTPVLSVLLTVLLCLCPYAKRIFKITDLVAVIQLTLTWARPTEFPLAAYLTSTLPRFGLCIVNSLADTSFNRRKCNVQPLLTF